MATVRVLRAAALEAVMRRGKGAGMTRHRRNQHQSGEIMSDRARRAVARINIEVMFEAKLLSPIPIKYANERAEY